jgi:hypothetical protein
MKKQRTPYRNYWIPILKSLVRRGGTAKIDDIYQDIWNSMEFNEYDSTYIEGSIPEPIWRNQTREAAYKLRKMSLLEPSQKHKIWQISEKGRRYLVQEETASGAPTGPNQSLQWTAFGRR